MKCIALVIGIDNYVNSDIWPTLRSAVKDANDIRQKLEELKFEVIVLLDDSNEKIWEVNHSLVLLKLKCQKTQMATIPLTLIRVSIRCIRIGFISKGVNPIEFICKNLKH